MKSTRQHCAAVYNVICDHAPTPDDVQSVRRLWDLYTKEHYEDDIFLKKITGDLYDGLRYGNWPWSVWENVQKG